MTLALADTLIRLLGGTPASDHKAVTGPGVWSLSTYAPVGTAIRHPARRMAEAQLLFHSHTWVAAAERAIYGRYVRSPWHLEDGNGDTIDPKTATGAAKVAYDLILTPSQTRRPKTRRALWSLTLRHMGLCGLAHWYLDQRDAMAGTPLETLYINPARLTAVENQSGDQLGWMLDAPDNPNTKPGQRATPFELDEILTFRLDEPDSGHYAIGIAETVYNEIVLEKQASQHMQQVLASGGRKAGLITPKEGATMNDDAWQALIRDYRNIVGDPEAAKRLHIARGALDFTSTSLTPQELELGDLMKTGREDILAGWGVPLSQIGIMESRGMNSGETVKYEEAALWQGAIEFRAQPFEETVQHLLDRFTELGADLRLVVETPTFDDQAPLFTNAERARAQPLTNDERRALLGLDPLEDEELGSAILIDKSMVPLFTVPASEPETQEEEPEPSAVMKASLPDELASLRERLVSGSVTNVQQAVTDVLAAIRRDVRERVERNYEHLRGRRGLDADAWWNENRWASALTEAINPRLSSLVTEASRSQARRFKQSKADDYISRVAEYVKVKGGERIRGILQRTRDELSKLIVQGVNEGLSPAQLGDVIEDATGLNEYRAELIARTETALAYNDATLRTYREFDVTEVQAIDGDVDEECASRNGRIFPLHEAEGISDHPNGTLDWLPVVP